MSWLAPATSPEPFHTESVNRADFQYKQGERQQPVRPRDELERAGGSFAGESSSRDAYKAWEPQPLHRHQPPAYQKPEGGMELSTSYGNQFASVGHAYARLPPIRPESQHRLHAASRDEAAPIDATGTEQAASFPVYRRAQLAEAKQPSFRPARQYRPPETPFAGRSSYAGDFDAAAAASPAEKARPVRHEDQLRLSTEPMESRGGSNSEYGVGAVLGGGVRRQPIVPRGELTVASGPFAADTTQRGAFAPPPGPQQPRREPVRPRGELELSREPLGAVTTSRDVFTPKAREGPPPTRRRQQPQQPQPAGQVAG